MHVHVRGSYVVEEARKDSYVLYVGHQGDGSTFNCLVNRALNASSLY